jgi:Xaa-Pro dipeptidase
MDRIAKLAEILTEHGVDVFLAQSAISLQYLANFPEDSHERFLTFAVHSSGASRLICPTLSRIQAERIGFEDIRDWRDGEDPLVHFAELAEDWNLRTGIILVDDFMPSKMLIEVQSVLPTALYRSGGELLAQLMGRKDSHEIQRLCKAGKIADETFNEVIGHIKEGMTEIELQQIIEGLMRAKGGDPQFCIVGFESGAAESHHINGLTKLEKDTLVLMDFGCSFEGYQSDITRCVMFGKATPKHREIYDIVYRAYFAAVEVGKAGVKPSSIDQAARGTIEKSGYGEFFTHRTGHGIGMRGHEAPNITSDNHVPLEPGNCFSIEPGIYLPNEFGVRLENLFQATESGLVSFNQPISPTLIEI